MSGCLIKPQNLIPVEEARKRVLDAISPLDTELVPLLDAIGRICARDQKSDIDISPFDHSAMDGFALVSADIEQASPENPIELPVVAEIPAGDYYDDVVNAGYVCAYYDRCTCSCEGADTVVKFEIVTNIENEGRTPGRVAFTAPSVVGANIREKGEEIHVGEVAISGRGTYQPCWSRSFSKLRHGVCGSVSSSPCGGHSYW